MIRLLLALTILLLIVGMFAVQAFNDEVCVSAMIQDATSVTTYPKVCS